MILSKNKQEQGNWLILLVRTDKEVLLLRVKRPITTTVCLVTETTAFLELRFPHKHDAKPWVQKSSTISV